MTSWRIDEKPPDLYRIVRWDTKEAILRNQRGRDGCRAIADGKAERTGIEHLVINERTDEVDYEAMPPDRRRE